MLEQLGKGLLGRLLSYGALALGFWLLYLAFDRSSIELGALGGLIVLAAMYLMSLGRRGRPARRNSETGKLAEDDPGDSIDGSSQGN
jgi:hypothetical protein